MNGESQPTFASASWRLLGWLLDVIACAALAWSVSLNARVMKLELWQAGTNAEFYSTSDHLAYASQQQAEIGKIWIKMAEIEAQRLKELSELRQSIAVLPQSLANPPEWFQNYVKENLARFDRRLESLEVNQAQRLIRESAEKAAHQQTTKGNDK